MKALVKTSPEPGLSLRDWPDPKPAADQVVVRVMATSLCGTDAHVYNWDSWASSRLTLPRILGHEMCGEVVEVGADVTSVRVGDYVAAESHLTCGVCFQCRTGRAHVCKQYRILGIDFDGSYAQAVALPERVLWKTDRTLPPELACLQEPLDVSDYRLRLARGLGATHVVNVKAMAAQELSAVLAEATGGEGVDASLEMSGDPDAIHLAFRTVKNGGRVTLFGIPAGAVSLDLSNEIIFKGIRIYGVTGRRQFETWYTLAGLLKAGLDLKPLVTHQLPMSDFAKGFELINSQECGKVVLLP